MKIKYNANMTVLAKDDSKILNKNPVSTSPVGLMSDTMENCSAINVNTLNANAAKNRV